MYEPDQMVNSHIKRVLNSDIDTTNIVGFIDWLKLSTQTLDTIINTIELTYGKNALNHLVIYNNIKSFNVFTNDGIHILKSMEFCSPLQEYITNNIRYIGERVEQAASDGTSTAILAAAFILKSIQGSYLSDYEDKVLIDSSELQKLLKENEKEFINVVDTILTKMEEYRIDLKTISTDMYKKLIYSLVYTTSKGNKELSEMVVKIFENRDIPMEEFSGYNYIRAQVENSTNFELIYENADISVNISENRSADYNDKLGTAIDHEDCDLIIIPDAIDEIRDVELVKQMTDYINESIRPVIILTNGMNSLLQTDLLKKAEGKQVVFCQYLNYCVDFKINPLELKVILYSNKKKGYTATNKNLMDSIIEDVYCHIENGKLKVYIEGKESVDWKPDSRVHPGYKNPDWFPEYTQLLKNIKFELDSRKASHVIDISVKKIIEELTRMYRYMICPHHPVLGIGGKSTDHLANINVVEDVLGTVVYAIKHGVILDGLLKMCMILDEFKFLNKSRNKIAEYISLSFIYLYNLSHKAKIYFHQPIMVMTHNPDTKNFAIELLYSLRNMKDSDEKTDLKRLSYVDFEEEKEVKLLSTDNEDTCLVQSYESFRELFIRLKEVIPRLITTVNVIVPGEVNLKKE